MTVLLKAAARLKAHWYYRQCLKWQPNLDNATRHGLPGQLLVSLTSFGARFATLEATIRCLLCQSVAPDAIILWVGEADHASIPSRVKALQSSIFRIEITRDTRSYKKIMPCLMLSPHAFIVTCDDDSFYPRIWLETLLKGWQPEQKTVWCNRAHKVRLDTDGKPMPYADWEQETRCQKASPLIFPTGVGGVLYEPGVFHEDVTNEDVFKRLCPTADDVWLYWMAALKGNQPRTTSLLNQPLTWPSSQRTSLRDANVPRGGGNDVQIANMLEAYGNPFGSRRLIHFAEG